MAGIYIHIPFCIKRCNYCDFYSTIKIGYIDEYLKSLDKEIEIRADYLKNQLIETIYFGGGTPSILEANKIEKVLKSIRRSFTIANNTEITMEVNPDDSNKEYFEQAKSFGINRISIGVQSFDDKMLKLMGRRHNSKQAYECIESAIKADIHNISIDLIYGLPGLNIKSWNSAIKKAVELPIKHLSAYHLTYEKGTSFYKSLMEGSFTKIDENDSWRQFELIHNLASASNFEHYEISNFAKKGYYSKHNSNYWNGSFYLGLGPSAHSFNGNTRNWNYSNLNKYINSINLNKTTNISEELTITDKANEYLLTGLRTNIGIDFEYYKKKFGENANKILKDGFEKYLVSKHAKKRNNFGYLTLKGWFISDKIIADLMILK
jgi:putative oxygen-independent coproporphyrinogen III oxidase